MPSLVKRVLREKAVYWPPLAPDRAGQPRSGTPVEIRCKWNERFEQRADSQVSFQGRLAKSRILVDQQLAVGGHLLFGELTEDTPEDPKTARASEIIGIDKERRIRVNEYQHIAYL